DGENEKRVEEALALGRARALARHVALLRRRRLEHGLDGLERRQLGGSFEGLRERPLDVVVDPVDALALASGFYGYRRLRSRFGERTGETVDDHLVEPLWMIHVLERVLADLLQVGGGAEQGLGRLGGENLPAGRRRARAVRA